MARPRRLRWKNQNPSSRVISNEVVLQPDVSDGRRMTPLLVYTPADIDLAEPAEDGVKKRKKRNRWGDAQENKAAGLMGLPTMIMANMTNEQLEAYTLHLRIEEISQKLRINDVVPADGDRWVVYHHAGALNQADQWKSG